MSTDQVDRTPPWAQWPWALLIIGVAAIATRAMTFGNPLVDMDDQFYWLVGRSWWDGRWPIVDVWDRKPVGLFLLYAAIAGIDRSILAVQIASLLFAAATAVLIRQAAMQIASSRSALFAAVTYLAFLPPFWGQSGQSPVFYNLFIAGAGLLLLTAWDRSPAEVRKRALLAMLLSGIALAMKQVSIAEGVYFGLAFLYLLYRRGQNPAAIALTASAMIAVALLPTILGILLFLLRGNGALEAYVYASYISIFTKLPGSGTSSLAGLAYLFLFGGPLLIAAAIGLKSPSSNEDGGLVVYLVAGWIVAAIVGYLLVPYFFAHYALPLLVPLSILAARAFDRPIGKLLFGALLLSCLMTGRLTDLAGNRRAAHDFDRLAKTVHAAAGKDGCLYVANGPVALYTVVPDCGVTPYAFPYHLTLATESTALGVDQSAEIEKIFAARPAVVLTQDNQRYRQTPAVQATLARLLAAGYRQIGQLPADATEELRTVRIWQRNDLALHRRERP